MLMARVVLKGRLHCKHQKSAMMVIERARSSSHIVSKRRLSWRGGKLRRQKQSSDG
jgi:hypothetical protein